jgi:hypothetical protein
MVSLGFERGTRLAFRPSTSSSSRDIWWEMMQQHVASGQGSPKPPGKGLGTVSSQSVEPTLSVEVFRADSTVFTSSFSSL